MRKRLAGTVLILAAVGFATAAAQAQPQPQPLLNGDFEQYEQSGDILVPAAGTWTTQGNVSVAESLDEAQQTIHAAFLQEEGSGGHSSIKQVFNLPAAHPVLSFRYHFIQNAGGANTETPPDSFSVFLIDSAGNRLVVPISAYEPTFTAAYFYQDTRTEPEPLVASDFVTYTETDTDPEATDRFRTVALNLASVLTQMDNVELHFVLLSADNEAQSAVLIDDVQLDCPEGFCCNGLDVGVIEDGDPCTFDDCPETGAVTHTLCESVRIDFERVLGQGDEADYVVLPPGVALARSELHPDCSQITLMKIRGVTITAFKVVEPGEDETVRTAIIFDSANPSGGDYDLRTPNEAGHPTNDTAYDNILIIESLTTDPDDTDANCFDADGDGLVDDPNDQGGAGVRGFRFKFHWDEEGQVRRVFKSAKVVLVDDVDGDIQLWKEGESVYTRPIGESWDSGITKEDFPDDGPEFDEIRVNLGGSGAVAEILLNGHCRCAEPAPADCTCAAPAWDDPPVPDAATLKGLTLTIHFDRHLAAGPIDEAAFSHVVADLTRYNVLSAAASGKNCVLALDDLGFAKEPNQLDYAVQGVQGPLLKGTNDISVADFNIGHLIVVEEVPAPKPQYALLRGSQMKIVFDGKLREGNVAVKNFSDIVAAGREWGPLSAAAYDNYCVLELQEFGAKTGSQVTYKAGTKPLLEGVDGKPVDDFIGLEDIQIIPPQAIACADLPGDPYDKLMLTFDLPLKVSGVQLANFVVNWAGQNWALLSGSVHDDNVTVVIVMKPDGPPAPGTDRLDYAQSAEPLLRGEVAGVPVVDFGIDIVPLVAPQPVSCRYDKQKIYLTFDAPLDRTQPNINPANFVAVNAAQKNWNAKSTSIDDDGKTLIIDLVLGGGPYSGSELLEYEPQGKVKIHGVTGVFEVEAFDIAVTME